MSAWPVETPRPPHPSQARGGALDGAAVLGYEVIDRQEGWIETALPGQPEKGPVPTLLFQHVPEPTPGKNRLHIDVNATDRDQEA